MSDQRRVSYFYDAEIGNYHYGQGKVEKTNKYLGDCKTHTKRLFILINYGDWSLRPPYEASSRPHDA